MFNPRHYREKAFEYAERGRSAIGPTEAHEFKKLEKSFAALADNEQWLLKNHHKTVSRPDPESPGVEALAEQENHVLRCLGAALLMQWNTLPRKLQRELFDNAGVMGDTEVGVLRGRIARFLHKHKDRDSLPVEDPEISTSVDGT